MFIYTTRVSEWLLFNQFYSYIMARTSYIFMTWWWSPLVLKHADLDFYSTSSLKQQSTGRHVAPLGHIILIPSQPVFVLTGSNPLLPITSSIRLCYYHTDVFKFIYPCQNETILLAWCYVFFFICWLIDLCFSVLIRNIWTSSIINLIDTLRHF